MSTTFFSSSSCSRSNRTCDEAHDNLSSASTCGFSVCSSASTETFNHTQNCDHKKTVYVTLTGRLWHRKKDCYALRNAFKIIPVNAPDPKLNPCWRCASDQPPDLVTLRPDERKNQLASVLSTSNGKISPSDVFVTRTGKLYHADEKCHSLRLAYKVIRVSSPSPELLPCWKCVGEKADKAVVNRSEKPQTGSKLVKASLLTRIRNGLITASICVNVLVVFLGTMYFRDSFSDIFIFSTWFKTIY